MWPALAVLLLLITPFVVFLAHHSYSVANPEFTLCLAVAAFLALALSPLLARSSLATATVLGALLTLALDVQFDQLDGGKELVGTLLVSIGLAWTIRDHVAPVIALFMGTILVTTLIIPTGAASVQKPAAPPTSRSGQPFVLHLVLDEHLGIDGFPDTPEMTNVASYVRSFFEERGFLLFGRAYSEYYNTRHSLGHLVNLSPERYQTGLFRTGERYDFELNRNEYFGQLAAAGYEVSAYQSAYLNLCADDAQVAQCEAYDYTGIGELQSARLPWDDELALILAAYSRRVTAYGELEEQYSRLRAWFAARGTELPHWPGPAIPRSFAPISGNLVMQRLTTVLSAATRGQYVFAHILIPHHPYVYGADCSLRPPDQWVERVGRDVPKGHRNTAEGRLERYAVYGQQIRCTYRTLATLLASIPEELQRDAVIIVHSDHGSKINVTEPILPEALMMTDADYADAYSTLFAVRSAALPTGYDDRVAPITCLLAALHQSHFTSVSTIERCSSSRTVFLFGPREDATPVPLPIFSRGTGHFPLAAGSP
jgi:hypothetical protein